MMLDGFVAVVTVPAETIVYASCQSLSSDFSSGWKISLENIVEICLVLQIWLIFRLILHDFFPSEARSAMFTRTSLVVVHVMCIKKAPVGYTYVLKLLN